MDLQFYLQDTMLIERLCGVGLYCLVLLVACNGIAVSKPTSVKKWLIFYAVVLATMGFFFVPSSTTDLSRLTLFMHDWSAHDLAWLVDRCANSTTPTYIAYFWLIGQFHVDGLLPAVTALLYYLLLFSCYWDYAKRNNCSNSSVAVGVAFLMCIGIYVQVISGIRSCLAFALVIRAVYTECAMGRGVLWNIPLYALAFTLHSAAIALGIVRLVHLAFRRKGEKGGRIGSLVLAAVMVALLATAGSSFVEAMFEKGASYLSGNVYSYFWEYLIHVIQMAFVVYSLFLYRKRKAGMSESSSEIWRFVAILSAAVVVSLPFDYSIFTRYASVVGMLAPLVAISLMNSLGGQKARAYRHATCAVAAVILLLVCTRGDLSSYKFFLM